MCEKAMLAKIKEKQKQYIMMFEMNLMHMCVIMDMQQDQQLK